MREFSIFKELEAASERRIASGGLAIFRLDGSNFSRYTAQFDKPFSIPFEKAMDAAALAVYKRVLNNALLVYVGSDEISVVVSDAHVELPYGGRVSKLVSLTAAHASAGFISTIPASATGTPVFDSRLIEFTDSALIREYITWRRLDTRKNATSMAAGALKSHKELMGVSTRERGALLEGTEFEKIPEGTFNGRFMVKSEEGFDFVPATRELAEELCASAKLTHDHISELKAANALVASRI